MATKSNSRKAAALNNADLAHVDELDMMVTRLYGLECAVANLETDNWGSGVHQLVQDIIKKMEKCAADFEAARASAKVRSKNSQQAA